MRKILLTVPLLLAVSTAQSITPSLAFVTIAKPSVTIETKWQAAESYILKNATNVPTQTLIDLKREAATCIQTWSVVVGEAGFVQSGPGIGWPAAQSMITFSTTLEALTAAALVQAATTPLDH